MSANYDVLHSAFVIKKAYESIWSDICVEYDLTRVEIDVLAFLANHSELDTANDIVEYRMIAKSHVSKAVDELMSRGFITATRGESGDRRRIHLHLTENASQVVEVIVRKQREFIKNINSGINKKEREIFAKVSQMVAENAASMIE